VLILLDHNLIHRWSLYLCCYALWRSTSAYGMLAPYSKLG